MQTVDVGQAAKAVTDTTDFIGDSIGFPIIILVVFCIVVVGIPLAIKALKGGYWHCSGCGSDYYWNQFHNDISSAERKHKKENPGCNGDLYSP